MGITIPQDPVVALRLVLHERGITLRLFAESLETSMSAAWRWLRAEEAKRSRPGPIVRVAIEQLYGVRAELWMTPDERAALSRASTLKPTSTRDGG